MVLTRWTSRLFHFYFKRHWKTCIYHFIQIDTLCLKYTSTNSNASDSLTSAKSGVITLHKFAYISQVNKPSYRHTDRSRLHNNTSTHHRQTFLISIHAIIFQIKELHISICASECMQLFFFISLYVSIAYPRVHLLCSAVRHRSGPCLDMNGDILNLSKWGTIYGMAAWHLYMGINLAYVAMYIPRDLSEVYHINNCTSLLQYFISLKQNSTQSVHIVSYIIFNIKTIYMKLYSSWISDSSPENIRFNQ